MKPVAAPPGVTLPTVPLNAVNQRFPSGPGVMSKGPLTSTAGPAPSFGTPKDEPGPAVVFPIAWPPKSAYQRAPSGPSVMPSGRESALGRGMVVGVRTAFAEPAKAAVAPSAAIVAAMYRRLRFVPFTVEPRLVGRDGIVPPAWWSDTALSAGFGRPLRVESG